MVCSHGHILSFFLILIIHSIGILKKNNPTKVSKRALFILHSQELSGIDILYEISSDENRKKAVRELFRVTKQGGVVFVAFQSRIRMTITSLLYPQYWKPHDRVEAIIQFGKTGIFNHQDQGRFTGAYYFPIEEIRPFMESHGFETIDLIGSSSIGGLLSKEQQQYWKDQGDEQQLLEMLIKTAKDPSVLGISSHLMYIGRRT